MHLHNIIRGLFYSKFLLSKQNNKICDIDKKEERKKKKNV